ENYRSSPEILGLANQLIAATGRTKALTATRPSGPPPSRVAYADPAADLAGIAILVRMNAQLAPIESTLTTAGIPYVVRGGRFYERPAVRAAIRVIQRAKLVAVGEELPAAIQAVLDR